MALRIGPPTFTKDLPETTTFASNEGLDPIVREAWAAVFLPKLHDDLRAGLCRDAQVGNAHGQPPILSRPFVQPAHVGALAHLSIWMVEASVLVWLKAQNAVPAGGLLPGALPSLDQAPEWLARRFARRYNLRPRTPRLSKTLLSGTLAETLALDPQIKQYPSQNSSLNLTTKTSQLQRVLGGNTRC